MTTTTDTPPGPRNLAAPVAQLLRGLGFEVWEQAAPTASMSLITGWWSGSDGARFVFQYAHHHPAAAPTWWGGCSLGVHRPGQAPQDCFTMTQVRRLREVRLLLLQNECFAQARASQLFLLATATPSLCPSTPIK